MYRKCILIIFLFVIALVGRTSGQDNTIKKDSLKIYKDIESFSKRSGFKGFVYQLLFKPVPAKKKKIHGKGKGPIGNSYVRYEGKIIRHIYIETLDPFGYSVYDTTGIKQSHLIKYANKLHVKTQRVTIQNYLLIRTADSFDSLLVKESERLIRINKYIHDVSFVILPTSAYSDSVDIYIREQDNWSLIPGINVSSSLFTLELTENNFVGLGHESKNSFTWYHRNGNFAYSLNYFIPNFRNTYINSTIHYDEDQYGNTNRIVAIDRPFFSSFAKWAAGVNFTKIIHKDSVNIDDPFLTKELFIQNIQDYWGGNSIQIARGNSENDRTTNLITTLRFLRIRYTVNENVKTDTLHVYADENTYLSGIGISRRKYVQDNYLFKFGLTEDVPVGSMVGITYGYFEKNNSGRFYLGGRIAFGNYNEWGYLSASMEYGTFFRSSHAEQGLLSAGVIYFSNMKEIGKWKIRQFVNPQVSFGINEKSLDYSIVQNTSLPGESVFDLTNKNQMELTFQTQTYSPWTVIGFHFGPFLSYSAGLAGYGINGFNKSKIYSKIGIGVLIKNDNLVLSTFQLSFSFYAITPGNLDNVLKVNSIKTTDFTLDDFSIGKPHAITN
jgi:hypothetical protein